MEKVYLRRRGTDEYLCINVMKQTSTGWHTDLTKVERLSDTLDRSLARNFNTFANLSLDEVIQKAEHLNSFVVHRIDDGSSASYEYW